MRFRQARWPLRDVMSLSGGSDFVYAHDDVDDVAPEGMLRSELRIPNAPESEVLRHYVNLSQMTYSVDNGIYPLGSCTMKYNPKVADRVASMHAAQSVHPCAPESLMQGSLRMMHELEAMLCAISGMDAVTLQPPAGAQGEFTGMLVTRAYHEHNDDVRRDVIVPDTAHGTNPASAMMAGYRVVEVPSTSRGCVDLDALIAALGEDTAVFMITNPSTLGLFEPRIDDIADAVHDQGALLYYDGANLNAILGQTTPGRMGFDIMHFNLHKTFATPHGGGGPGAGPVGVRSRLEPFLPTPRVVRDGDTFRLDHDRPLSVGKVAAFHGNFGVLLRAYAYILRKGGDGLREASTGAVLNSNYLMRRLVDGGFVPSVGDGRMHEFVVSPPEGVRALDVAKGMMDHGAHPPTVYFPLIVHEAMMVEPTEDATSEDLDRYAVAMIAASRSTGLEGAPTATASSRVDEVMAVKSPAYSHRMMR